MNGQQSTGCRTAVQRENRHWEKSRQERGMGKREFQALYQSLESWDISSVLWEQDEHPGHGIRVMVSSSLPSFHSSPWLPASNQTPQTPQLLRLHQYFDNSWVFYCKRHHFLLIWVLEWHWQAEYLGSKWTLRGKGKYIPKNTNWKESNSIIHFVWYHSGTSSHIPVIFRFWWRQQVLLVFGVFFGLFFSSMQKKKIPRRKFP